MRGEGIVLVGGMKSLHAECIELALLGLGEVSRIVASPIPGQSLRGGFALWTEPVEQAHPTSLFTRSHKERERSAASASSGSARAA